MWKGVAENITPQLTDCGLTTCTPCDEILEKIENS
jgi:hypothetical protein